MASRPRPCQASTPQACAGSARVEACSSLAAVTPEHRSANNRRLQVGTFAAKKSACPLKIGSNDVEIAPYLGGKFSQICTDSLALLNSSSASTKVGKVHARIILMHRPVPFGRWIL